MPIAIVTPGEDLGLDRVALPVPPVPAIEPAPAPRYLPPVSVPMNPNPTLAPAPAGTFMGEGGVPFGSAPVIYAAPESITPRFETHGWWTNSLTGEVVEGDRTAPPSRAYGWRWAPNMPADYTPPPVLKWDPDAPAPENETLAPRRGDKQNMPVPTGMQPTKPPVGEATPQVAPPGSGPVRGSFLGADLSIVPLWVWLAGAALIGARILK
jgi:hypothetical protein